MFNLCLNYTILGASLIYVLMCIYKAKICLQQIFYFTIPNPEAYTIKKGS